MSQPSGYALHALEAERTRLEVMIADVRHQLGTKAEPVETEPEPGPVTKKTRKKRVMTPEGKERLIAALKARWAKVKQAKAEAEAKATTKTATKKAKKSANATKKAAKKVRKEDGQFRHSVLSLPTTHKDMRLYGHVAPTLHKNLFGILSDPHVRAIAVRQYFLGFLRNPNIRACAMRQ